MTKKQQRINEKLTDERVWQERCHEASLILQEEERTQKHPRRLQRDSLRDVLNLWRLKERRRGS